MLARKPIHTLGQAEAEVARLEDIMADALTAMDKGEYGAARRILRAGRDAPLLTVTSVIAKDGG